MKLRHKRRAERELARLLRLERTAKARRLIRLQVTPIEGAVTTVSCRCGAVTMIVAPGGGMTVSDVRCWACPPRLELVK